MSEKENKPGRRPGQLDATCIKPGSSLLQRWTAAVRAAALVHRRLEAPWLERERSEDSE